MRLIRKSKASEVIKAPLALGMCRVIPLYLSPRGKSAKNSREGSAWQKQTQLQRLL